MTRIEIADAVCIATGKRIDKNMKTEFYVKVLRMTESWREGGVLTQDFDSVVMAG